jgi:hypothetical protein
MIQTISTVAGHLSAGQARGAAEPSGANQTGDRGGAGAANVSVGRLCEGIVRITLKPGVRITAEDGLRTRGELLALTGGARGGVLLDVTGVGSVSREAVGVYSAAVTVTAFAILGRTPVDRVIAHGLLGLPLPSCPSAYFTDEEEALRWLRSGNSTDEP